MFWNIGKRVNLEILNNQRAAYGKPIVATLWRQLSWSHFKLLLPVKDELQRNFYAQLCRVENWNVATLRQKMQSMLFERTALSKKNGSLVKLELKQVTEENRMSPDLVFRDPYILDFLGLKDTYQESDLEQAILRKLEQFILELGAGFAFIDRQKRMIIDGKDFRLNLLFYHRKLKRMIAIDLLCCAPHNKSYVVKPVMCC